MQNEKGLALFNIKDEIPDLLSPTEKEKKKKKTQNTGTFVGIITLAFQLIDQETISRRVWT